jgi:hypothetical protein
MSLNLAQIPLSCCLSYVGVPAEQFQDNRVCYTCKLSKGWILKYERFGLREFLPLHVGLSSRRRGWLRLPRPWPPEATSPPWLDRNGYAPLNARERLDKIGHHPIKSLRKIPSTRLWNGELFIKEHDSSEQGMATHDLASATITLRSQLRIIARS